MCVCILHVAHAFVPASNTLHANLLYMSMNDGRTLDRQRSTLDGGICGAA